MINSEEVCFSLLQAESERVVDDIVTSTPELSNPNNWFPMDGRETNFNVVTNQASVGSKALTELCTNMVDAVLMKHAFIQGIDPVGPDAPQSVIAGVRDLVELRGARSGILAEVDDESYLRAFAEENLIIGVTGGTRRNESLCFTFIDNGEGQHAEVFEDTFLSLSKGNKSDIPFVQGKYNMGSSGVLSYCGRRWYKLIVSRRYDESKGWGWTLVRRRPREGMPVAEFFKLDGHIPTFQSTLLFPMTLNSGEPDDKVSISTGTVVKLYDYQMESAASFRNIREALNENLVSTVLPFRLMDYRVTPQRTGRRAQGVDERPFYGMEFLLLRRGEGEVADVATEDQAYEPGSKEYIGDVDHPDLGHIMVHAIVLRREIQGWLRAPRNTSRVFHSVNGQVQFKENRAYLSQRCRLPGLKDRIVVVVDASDLSEAAHNDVWKGDRQSLRATEIGQLYRNEVTKVIADSPYLRELQQRIAREETESLAREGQQSLFQDLVNTDPSIAQLLPGGELVKLPGYIGNTPGVEEYEGKYSPTFLHLVGRAIRQSGADIVPGERRRVSFETDVVNDYFGRPDNRGRVFTTGISDRFSYAQSLYNGRLTLTFTALADKVSPGDEFSVTIGLLDDAMPEPVTDELRLRVVEARRKRPPGPRPPGPRINDPNGDDEEETVEGRGLPPSKWLTSDGRLIGEEETDPWPEGFTDQDGGTVTDLGEGQMLYRINYDNAHFRRFLDRENNDLDKRVVAEQYRMGMLVLMMGLEDAYMRMDQTETKTRLEENIDEIRRLAAQGAATVVMSIAKTLPTIINPSSVEDPDE